MSRERERAENETGVAARRPDPRGGESAREAQAREEPSSLSALEERIAAEEEVICERVRSLERQVQTLHEHKVAAQQARSLSESRQHAEAELMMHARQARVGRQERGCWLAAAARPAAVGAAAVGSAARRRGRRDARRSGDEQ